MSEIAILTKEEQYQYEYPPVMHAEERVLCFAMHTALERKIKKLRTATNKVAFLLQYGYFKQCQRFFPINRFSKDDVLYVTKQLDLSIKGVHLSKYKNKMPFVHQTAICVLQG